MVNTESPRNGWNCLEECGLRRGPFPCPQRLTFGSLGEKEEESKGRQKRISQDENWENVKLPKIKVF